MVKLMAVAALLALAGCSTTPPPDNRVKEAPKDQYMASLPRTPESATLKFIRDEGFIGSAAFIYLMVDGEDVAKINVAESVELPVDPGTHQVCGQLRAIAAGKPICIDVALKPKQLVLIRPGIDINSGLVMYRDMTKHQ